MENENRHSVKSVVLLAMAAALAAALVALPPAGTAILPGGAIVQGWVSAPARRLYPLMLAAVAAFSLAAWRHAGRHLAGTRLATLRHMAWLPFLATAMHASAWIGATAACLVLPLGGTLLAAIALEEFLRRTPHDVETRRTRHFPPALFIFTTFLLLVFIIGFADKRHFNGGGDVCHYSVQVRNLVEKGCLDLTAMIESGMDADGIPDSPAVRKAYLDRSHLKRNSRGRIYSYHSYGFPLVVWPFRLAFGHFGDILAMSLIGALSLVGVRAACLAHGGPRKSADMVAALTGLSNVWVFTATSFLPEMLGFGLCAWAFWAIPAQHDPRRRMAATLAAAAACAYMPVAHVRFAPLACVLSFFFDIEGLLVRGESFWRRKFPRLILFTAICVFGWLALFLSHRSIFAGTAAYDYAGVAGSQPLGIWAAFADRRGILPVLPVICPCLAATAVAAMRGGATARRAAMALAALTGVLYCCCANKDAVGGACLNGRYVYNALPLLLPFLAIAFPKADRPGRVWMLFLALMPVLYFLFITPWLGGVSLVRAPAPIRVAFPGLQTFWEPFPSFFASGDADTRLVGSAFAVALLAVSFLACLRRLPRTRLAAAILLLLAFPAGAFVDRHDPPMDRAGAMSVLMANRHFHDFKLLSGSPENYFDAFRDTTVEDGAAYCLTDDAMHPLFGFRRLQCVKDLDVAAWDRRGRRWGQIRHGAVSTNGRRGFVAFRARGRVVRGAATLAARSLGNQFIPEVPLREGPFDVVVKARLFSGNGGANLYLSLDGNHGEVVVDDFDIVPWSPALERAIGPLPATATVFDFTSASAAAP